MQKSRFSPDGRYVIVPSDDGFIRVFDSAAGYHISDTAISKNRISHLVVGSNELIVVTSGGSKHIDEPEIVGEIFIVNYRTGQAKQGPLPHRAFAPQQNIRKSALQNPELRITTSSDGSRFVSWNSLGFRVWDSSAGQEVGCESANELEITDAILSPSGNRLAVVTSDGRCQIWDTDEILKVGPSLELYGARSGVAMTPIFSPNGRRILVQTDFITAQLWDAIDGSVLNASIRSYGALEQLDMPRFFPSGDFFVSCYLDETNDFDVWDSETGRVHGSTLRHPFVGEIKSVGIDEAQKKIVVCDGTTTVIWNITSTEEFGTKKLLVKGAVDYVRIGENPDRSSGFAITATQEFTTLSGMS